jgi:hypothetical protein
MAIGLILPLLAALLLLFVGAVVAVVVLIVAFRRPQPRAHDIDDQLAARTPLERAQEAASALTAQEWKQFHRWVNGERTPSPPVGEGICEGPNFDLGCL